MAGRPAKYDTPKELEDKITEYFNCIQGVFHIEKRLSIDGKSEYDDKVWDRAPEPATISGLALFLGFESRQSFYDYEKDGEFSYTVKRARLHIESEYEKKLSHQSPTGAIFALKNFGWKDKTEVDLNGNLNIAWEETRTYDSDKETNTGA